ncbi:MAG: hypothetical protein UW24_C0012G0024 [Parcubacteria group bacterium GW2011_GWA2_44_12]|nr:MAG: hypothetical protein UW24_C0012G0024 [Parcubacteria group bacterium GW2011_GWA2_44_12]
MQCWNIFQHMMTSHLRTGNWKNIKLFKSKLDDNSRFYASDILEGLKNDDCFKDYSNEKEYYNIIYLNSKKFNY